MASIIIRKLDDSIKARLRSRAARHGRSMEEEARAILKSALSRTSENHLAERIHSRFAAIGGFDFPAVQREPMREPPNFDK